MVTKHWTNQIVAERFTFCDIVTSKMLGKLNLLFLFAQSQQWNSRSIAENLGVKLRVISNTLPTDAQYLFEIR